MFHEWIRKIEKNVTYNIVIIVCRANFLDKKIIIFWDLQKIIKKFRSCYENVINLLRTGILRLKSIFIFTV